eukprot:4407367-Amphidinium_carterae.1
MDKDFDVEHTNAPAGAQMLRVFALHDDENGTMPVGLVLEESAHSTCVNRNAHNLKDSQTLGCHHL